MSSSMVTTNNKVGMSSSGTTGVAGTTISNSSTSNPTTSSSGSNSSSDEYNHTYSHWIDLWDRHIYSRDKNNNNRFLLQQYKKEFLQFRLTDETTREYVIFMLLFVGFILYATSVDLIHHSDMCLSFPMAGLLIVVFINISILIFMKVHRWWSFTAVNNGDTMVKGNYDQTIDNDIERGKSNNSTNKSEEMNNQTTAIKIKPSLQGNRSVSTKAVINGDSPISYHHHHHYSYHKHTYHQLISDLEIWIENMCFLWLNLTVDFYVVFIVVLFKEHHVDYQQMTNHTLPDLVVFAALLFPLVLYMIMKGVHFSLVVASMFFVAVTACGLIVYYELYKSWSRFIISFIFSIFAVAEYHRQVWHSYQVNRKLKKTLEENSRLAEEIKANELRHMIGNVAHDLKTPLSSFISGMEVIQKVASDLQQEVLWLNSSNGEKKTSKESPVSTATVATVSTSTPQSTASLLTGFEEKLSTILEVAEDVTNTNAFMVMTINRCIDYNKTLFGLKLTPKPENFLLKDCFDFTLKCLKNTYDHIKIECLYLHDSLQDGEIMLRTDKQWLQENLLCLLGNAAKYSIRDTKVIVKISIVSRNVIDRDGISSHQSRKIQLQPQSQSQGPEQSSKSTYSMKKFRPSFSKKTVSAAMILPTLSRSLSSSSMQRMGGNTRRVADYDDLELGKTSLDSSEGHTVRITHSTSKDYTPVSHSVHINSTSGSDKSSISMSSTGANPNTSVKYEVKNDQEFGSTESGDLLTDRFLRIEVLDTGPGIAEEYYGKLFQEPAQAARINGGTGLGLYSLAKRVEALGGDYGVKAKGPADRESVAGDKERNPEQKRGCKFWFAIPYQVVNEKEFLSSPSNGGWSNRASAGQGGIAGALNSSFFYAAPVITTNKKDSRRCGGGSRESITPSIERQPSIAEVDEEDSGRQYRSKNESSVVQRDSTSEMMLGMRTTSNDDDSSAAQPHDYSQSHKINQHKQGSCASSVTKTTTDLTGVSSGKSFDSSTNASSSIVPFLAELAENKKFKRSMNEIYTGSDGGDSPNDRKKTELLGPGPAETEQVSENDSNNNINNMKSSPLRVLIVDDSPAILKMTSLALKKQGFEVWTADNGFKAVHIFQEELQKQVQYDKQQQQLLQQQQQQQQKTQPVRHNSFYQLPWISGASGLFPRFGGSSSGSSSSSSIPVETSISVSSSVVTLLTTGPPPHPFDVVLMDFQMPVMGGLEAILEIRKIEQQKEFRGKKRSTIIGFSAKSDEHQIDEGYTNGMDGFINKPFTIAAFQSILTNLSRNR